MEQSSLLQTSSPMKKFKSILTFRIVYIFILQIDLDLTLSH